MKYFIVALVVSLAWIHQDWVIWPLLSEIQSEHDLVFGIPAGLGFQVTLSFATAAVWFLAVWKAWPTELESWASAGDRRGGHRSRGGRSERGGNNPRRDRGRDSQRGGRPSSERAGGDGNSPRRRRGSRSGRGRHDGSNPNPSSTQ